MSLTRLQSQVVEWGTLGLSRESPRLSAQVWLLIASAFSLAASDCPLTTLALALVGAGWLGSYVLSFTRMLVDLARPGISVSRLRLLFSCRFSGPR